MWSKDMVKVLLGRTGVRMEKEMESKKEWMILNCKVSFNLYLGEIQPGCMIEAVVSLIKRKWQEA